RYYLAESVPEIFGTSREFFRFPTLPILSGAAHVRKRRLIHSNAGSLQECFPCLTRSNLGKLHSRSSTNRGPCQFWKISIGHQSIFQEAPSASEILWLSV